jgi:hypothetical protein
MSNKLDEAVALLWTEAVQRFEAETRTSISTPGSITSLDELIASLADKHSSFKIRRHNGSRLERLRTLAARALEPIRAISDVLAQATKLVRESNYAFWGHN